MTQVEPSQTPPSAMRVDAIRLRSVRFDVAEPRVLATALTVPTLQVKIDVRRDDASRLLEIDVTLEPSESSPTGAAFSVAVTFTGCFSWHGDLPFTPDQFVEQNGPAILWPYLREIVASLTSRAGLPALHLPLLNFAKSEPAPSSEAASPQMPPSATDATK